jgi:hypothetical protein
VTSLFDLELFFGLGKLSRCSDVFLTLCQLGLRTDNLNNDLYPNKKKLRKFTRDLKKEKEKILRRELVRSWENFSASPAEKFGC